MVRLIRTPEIKPATSASIIKYHLIANKLPK
jgi:hypothetical protein